MSETDIKKYLRYDQDTGLFFWIVSTSNRAKVGSRAGTNRGGGYRRIHINRTAYYEHRLAWFFVFGEWPKEQIDHIDGNPSNNAISNLRLASHRQNCQNFRLRSNSTSGFHNVSLHKQTGKWCSYICKDYRKKHLGLFDSKEQAYAAYLDAKAKYHTFNKVPSDMVVV